MRHLQTNPLTGDTHQTTLEQDLQRARQCQPWLGTTWVYEVSGLARLASQSLHTTMTSVSCEKTVNPAVARKPRQRCHGAKPSRDQKTRT